MVHLSRGRSELSDEASSASSRSDPVLTLAYPGVCGAYGCETDPFIRTLPRKHLKNQDSFLASRGLVRKSGIRCKVTGGG
jgi:hypothetical protein